MFALKSRARFVQAIGAGMVLAGLGLFVPGVQQPLQAQQPDPATLLYVRDMGVTYINVGGPRRLPIAIIDIIDGTGQPVNGVQVNGNWSGCFKQNNDSAITETYFYTEPDGTIVQVDGRAVIEADKSYSCWGRGKGCDFVFTITAVAKDRPSYPCPRTWPC